MQLMESGVFIGLWAGGVTHISPNPYGLSTSFWLILS
jgi:hypothetical protein